LPLPGVDVVVAVDAVVVVADDEVVAVVAVALVPLELVEPPPGRGSKKTTRLKYGAPAPQPCPGLPADAELTEPDEFESGFVELASVTRVTPFISRSRDINRETSYCDFVQPDS
jgi:hypothetical protein